MYRLIEREDEFEIVGFRIEIFKEAMALKEIKEIHDRIIVATFIIAKNHKIRYRLLSYKFLWGCSFFLLTKRENMKATIAKMAIDATTKLTIVSSP